MIVKCIDNKVINIPKRYLDFGPDMIDDKELAISIGKYYIVYAIQTNRKTEAQWYFIYTDQGYLWWMPSVAFELYDNVNPKGWVGDNFKDYTTWSYPALHRWEIEEGIIDREKDAEHTFLSEVSQDPTFPKQAELDQLNIEFERQKRWKEYQKDLKIAKENGWERPEKPEDQGFV